ncbi:YjgN family protein [Roseiterribacter gracilis]|uniref:Membrane protein n=1 Tax=Roseiterribacter gracilis TaxID=2812848 RepID=A0A8S8XD93_9PROT|nr:membrane protein [Rhodospirillales bacterium TMPK1]
MHDVAANMPSGSRARVSWYGKTSELYALLATNILFKILTLGVFTFWARTRKRRYFWSHVEFLGDRFEYHGRGIELFLGMLFVAAAVLLPLAIASSLLTLALPDELKAIVQVFYFIALGFLTGAGVFRAIRYRLTRSAWRGLRFGLEGRAGRFGRDYLFRTFLMLITLSLHRPWFDAWYYRTLLTSTRYGDQHTESRPEGGELFGTYLVCWLLMVPTLGLSMAAYRVAFLRHLVARTTLAGLTVSFDATARDLIFLRVGNFLIVGAVLLVALGASITWTTPLMIGSTLSADNKSVAIGLIFLVFGAIAVTTVLPLLWQRRMRFFCTHFVFGGALAVDHIRATTSDAPQVGEGLEAAFDFDAVG